MTQVRYGVRFSPRVDDDPEAMADTVAKAARESILENWDRIAKDGDVLSKDKPNEIPMIRLTIEFGEKQ